MRMMTKLRGFLKTSTDCTRHIKMILAQNPRKQPTRNICKTVRHARYVAVKENRRISGFCGQKGHGDNTSKHFYSVLNRPSSITEDAIEDFLR